MLEIYAQLVAHANQVEECLEDLEPLIPELPETDEELDQLLDALAAIGETKTCYMILFAALIDGRKPDVVLLRNHPSALYQSGMVTALVPRMGGDVVDYLLWIARHNRWIPMVRSAACFALMTWLHGDDDRVTQENLKEVFLDIVPNLRIAGAKGGQASSDNVIHVCALAMALGEPLPLDYVNFKVRGKSRGRGKVDVVSFVEQQAQELLARYTQHSRYETRKLLPPTRTDIEPKRAPKKTVRKVGEKVGRNDPCPCGSGKKYKKCCMNKAPDEMPDAIALAPELLQAKIDSATPAGLKQLDLSTVPTELFLPLAQRMLDQSAFASFVSLLEHAPMTPELAKMTCLAMARATKFEEFGHVEAMADRLPEGYLAKKQGMAEVKLALQNRDLDAQLALLEEELKPLLGNAEELSHQAVAFLNWKLPALGTLLARAALGAGVNPRFARGLRAQLRDGRRRLGLEGTDEADHLVERILGQEEEANALVEQVTELQSLVARFERRAQKRQAAIADQEAEIERLSATLKETREESADTGATEKTAVLKQRLDEYKTRLTALQAERRSLAKELDSSRSELAARTDELAAADSAEAAEDAREDEHLSDEVKGPQPLRLPEFSPQFRANLSTFPVRVQREALRFVGDMSAGLDHAWQGSRKLQLRPDHFRQKVKRNHRLLFKVTDSTLHVIDLIDRKDLARRIDSL